MADLLPITRRYRICVDVEVSVNELRLEENLPGDTSEEAIWRANFNEAQRTLFSALLANPEVLNRFLEVKSIVEVEFANDPLLLQVAYGQEIDDEEVLETTIDQLSEAHKEHFKGPGPRDSKYNLDAMSEVRDAVETQIIAVSCNEIE